MAYGLENFCTDLHDILKAKGIDGLGEVAEKLKGLLVNPDFVAQTFEGRSEPQRVLYHDADSDAYVLAHIQEPGKSSKPHSHGASWAIYGNSRGNTDMTEYRRVNPESEDEAVLEISDRYRLGPGQSHAYSPHQIHSTSHPEGAWVIRITGGDLDKVPRYYFRPKKDKVLEPAAAK
jgi:hypothetical protein